jgi:ABC-type glycerol-3-phosphate transport system substrate-binding protein
MLKTILRQVRIGRYLALLVLLTGLMVLAACAGETPAEEVDEGESPEPTAETAEPTEAAEPEAEVVTIRMITHWTGEDAHTASMHLLYERFEAANPDIKLDIVEIPDWGQANTKVATECGAGNCPDIAFGQFVNSDAIDNGLVYNTDDFVASNQDIIDMTQLGGKYNDHFYRAFTSEISGFGCVYNRQLLADIGLSEFPTTWDELLEAGEAVKAEGKALTTLHAYWPVLFGFVQQSTEAGNQASIDGDWDSPTWVETMTAFEQLLPYLGPDELEIDDSSAPLRVVDGEMLYYCDGQWMIGNTGLSPEDAAATLGVAPFPTPSGVTMAGWNGYAIGETVYVNSEEPEKEAAAWRFLEFWATDEEVIKSFIVDAQSPMGVRTDLITPELAGPFLPLFIEVNNEADQIYTEVGAWPTVDIWGAVLPAFEELILGASPEDATEVMLEIFRAS